MVKTPVTVVAARCILRLLFVVAESHPCLCHLYTHWFMTDLQRELNSLSSGRVSLDY